MTIQSSTTIANRGLYIHIPFCVKKCDYCDFYSLPGCSHLINSYIDSLFQEGLRNRGMQFSTLYIGGGTPSLLGVEGLKKLMNGLGDIFDLSQVVEATIEVNPDSATIEFLETAKARGLNRVSIGVQSLSNTELTAVGRIHNAAQAISAIENAKKAGFTEISADTIAGLPGQTWESLRATLEKLVSIGIDHLSLYCLSLEQGTPLAENPPENLPSEDEQADLFEKAATLLAEEGFGHYEISNFSRSGHESKHNLNYWRGGEYLGLGPSAASHLSGKRYKNTADLCAYMDNPGGRIEDEESLKAREKADEEAMLRLRLPDEGLDIMELGGKFGMINTKALAGRLKKLAAEGLLLNEGARYRLPPRYILTCNPILTRVLGD
jgi:oxygen-independent coproporphyrinogen-3 oxidase